MAHHKVFGDLLHVLEVEERVETGFIYEIRTPVALPCFPLPSNAVPLLLHSLLSSVHLSEVSAQSLSLSLLKEDSIGGVSGPGGQLVLNSTQWVQSRNHLVDVAAFPGGAQNNLLPTMLSSMLLVPLSDKDTLISP